MPGTKGCMLLGNGIKPTGLQLWGSASEGLASFRSLQRASKSACGLKVVALASFHGLKVEGC